MATQGREGITHRCRCPAGHAQNAAHLLQCGSVGDQKFQTSGKGQGVVRGFVQFPKIGLLTFLDSQRGVPFCFGSGLQFIVIHSNGGYLVMYVDTGLGLHSGVHTLVISWIASIQVLIH